MMRIGIFGGSFNPIHVGHLLAAQSAAEAGGLDRVLLAPCEVSPFKRGATDLVSGPHRLEMVRLATAGDARLEPSDIDLARGGVSYAIDTVSSLSRRHPGDRLVFLIGLDTLPDLHKWSRIDEMLEQCEVMTIERPGLDRLPRADELGFRDEVAARLLAGVIPGRRCEISSSEIRRRIAGGQPIRYLVPDAVEAYIRRHRLYAQR